MPRKPDWLDFAHALHKEREAIQDKLPKGVEVWLTLSDYGHGAAEFSVHLRHREQDVDGFGTATTPAKALEKATEDMKKRYAERAKRPQLVASKPLVLDAKKDVS